jgi:hypothetical protein
VEKLCFPSGISLALDFRDCLADKQNGKLRPPAPIKVSDCYGRAFRSSLLLPGFSVFLAEHVERYMTPGWEVDIDRFQDRQHLCSAAWVMGARDAQR